MEKAQVYAKYKYAKIAPNKVRIVMDLVRNQSVADAQRILKFSPTKASDMILKTLNSAVANASHNLGLKKDDLFVSDIYVGAGPTMKRGRFKGRGRWHAILKRSSHLVVGLSERKQS